LRNLQGRFSAKKLDARWHLPFPRKEIDILMTAIASGSHDKTVKLWDAQTRQELTTLKGRLISN
jgi:hypothetical protein